MLRAWLDGYRNAFSCAGRERRRTYGIFLLFHFIALVVALIALTPVILKFSDAGQAVAILLILLAAAVPMPAIIARRGHDYGVGGWMLLAASVLLLGPLIGALLVLPPTPGAGEPNEYGPDPRV